MTKIKDVAREANVSIATVSRILSSDHTLSVSEDTRKRVWQTADFLNYKPRKKKSTKKLKMNQDNVYNIGIVSALAQEDEVHDPYFLSIRLGLEIACEQLPLNIKNIFRLEKGISLEKLHNLDGLIVIGGVDLSSLRDVYYENDNVVLVNHLPREGNYDVVASDLERAIEVVLNHLTKLNHYNIGYLGGLDNIKSVDSGRVIKEIEDARKVSYEKIMREKGLYNPENVFIGEWGPSSGYELMKQAIKKGNLPSAMIIASDPMAIGALRALYEEGINVPEDISLISFDDIEAAEFLNPPLSTVKIHAEEMGKMAAKLLWDRLNGRNISTRVVLDTELIIRKSCQAK